MNNANKLSYVNLDLNNEELSSETIIRNISYLLKKNRHCIILNFISIYFIPPYYDIDDFNERRNNESERIKFERKVLKRLNEYLVSGNKLKDYEYIMLVQALLSEIKSMINNREQRFIYFLSKFFEERNPNLYPIIDESKDYIEKINKDLRVLSEYYSKIKSS